MQIKYDLCEFTFKIYKSLILFKFHQNSCFFVNFQLKYQFFFNTRIARGKQRESRAGGQLAYLILQGQGGAFMTTTNKGDWRERERWGERESVCKWGTEISRGQKRERERSERESVNGELKSHMGWNHMG